MTGTLLTTLEVAERLGISSWAVAQAVRNGALQPAARTNDDFLFTERAVAAFAERRAEAAATPLAPPAAVSRSEWSGDLDRLNTWLKDLNESVPEATHPTETIALPMQPPAAVPTASSPVPIAAPEEALPAVDFTPPPRPAPEPPAAADPERPPRAPEPLAAAVAEPPAAPDPQPVAEAIAELTPAPAPEPVAEAIAEPVPAPEPVAAAIALPPPAPAPEPVAEVLAEPPLAADVGPDAVEEPHLPTPAEATAPLPEAVAALSSGLSRQAVLVVEPIERFRILRDVADRLATIPGIADARLERLESGLASYRLSFGEVRPSGEAIASALAPLGLQVMLVDSE